VVRLYDLDEQLIGQLVNRARSDGLRLTGEKGLLAQLTKRTIESAGGLCRHMGTFRSLDLQGYRADEVGYTLEASAQRRGGHVRRSYASRRRTSDSPSSMETLNAPLLRCLNGGVSAQIAAHRWAAR
jgi:hypothetical protein